jgi:curved DNA-binding protein CbpA
MIDYYAIVSADPNSTSDEIKRAYRQKAFELHPDKNQGDPYYEEKFKELQEAYEILSNESTRRNYDLLFKQRLDYIVRKAQDLRILSEETFPDYIKGIYLLEIKENNKELAKLYSSNKIVFDVMYKSFALSQFNVFCDHRPKTNNWIEDIRYFRDAKSMDFIKILQNPIRLLSHPDQGEFENKYIKEIIDKNNGKLTPEKIIISCVFLPKSLSIDDHKIIFLEYLNIIARFSSLLEGKYKDNMRPSNNTTLAKGLHEALTFIKSRGLKSLKSGTVWNLVLSFLTLERDDAEKELMEVFRKDKEEDKIDNIRVIMELANISVSIDDFSEPNLFGFAYTIKQLNRYILGSELAFKSLEPLKNIFLDYIEKYYFISANNNKEINASALINHLGEKILKDDNSLSSKLKYFWTGDALSKRRYR